MAAAGLGPKHSCRRRTTWSVPLARPHAALPLAAWTARRMQAYFLSFVFVLHVKRRGCNNTHTSFESSYRWPLLPYPWNFRALKFLIVERFWVAIKSSLSSGTCESTHYHSLQAIQTDILSLENAARPLT
ncbi:hypothetical protein BV25DRAFT_369677 [Artomyces pyxidatus]|uniref:Uncharacterized protein n=1 Tax=Artomyces pyxidatus TaxID=48021 RepID=A0ACB8T575_9AGAM|nr:hypothetical protein BV25DRAFT_369677 [Artomyces pyxidatus]